MHKVNTGWLYGNVKPYFEQKGHKLLRDDLLFIEKCLSNIPQERHRRVMRDYLSIWDATVLVTEKSSKNGLNARYEENTYLRNLADEKGDPPT